MSGLLGDLLDRVTQVGWSLGTARESLPLPLGDRCAALLSGSGEATELALARGILDSYGALEPQERPGFFAEMRDRFGVDAEALERVIARWRESGDAADARALHHATEPRSQELIRRLNRATGGTRDIVAMRADLRKAMREDESLAPLDADFHHLLSSWFNRGFLELRRIDWFTPAAILEKIIRYEAVHAIKGWSDLRRRTAAADRRLYGFFHPAMADEPLIFVEVALAEEIPGAIAPILAEERKELAPSDAKVAVFYSISNCQLGLAGVSFGNFLIKQVVEELSSEFGQLSTFVTLSPVPGFRRWAEGEAEQGEDGALSEEERALVTELGGSNPPLEDESLRALLARYLIEAKGRGEKPADPVARFHLGNGARLEQLHLASDLSERGMGNSWGTMVNYLYDLSAIERNHEAYASEGAVAAAPSLRRLVRN